MAAPVHDLATRRLFARNVRRIRRESGVSQETLWLESGVTQSNISEIEAGKRNTSLDLIGAIAKALGVPVAALFDEAATRSRSADDDAR